MNKHTPGPWEFWNERVGDDHSTFNIQTVSMGEIIALVDCGWGKPFDVTHNVHEANARLISASPDMLVALRELVAICDLYGGHSLTPDSPSIVRARAAINKAEGSEQ